MLAKSSGDARSGRRAAAPGANGRGAGRMLARRGEDADGLTAPSTVDLGALCAFLRQSSDATKRRLSRALHDSPAQTVSAALLTLFLLEREKGSMSASAQHALHDAQALLSSCGDELRRLSHELYPPLLDEVGLHPPLRALVRKAGPGRVRLKLDEVPRLPRRAEEAAYRFAEEALVEVLNLRSAVDLELASDGALGVTLSLAGRLRAAGPSRRLALISLEHRVREAGGDFTFREIRGDSRSARTADAKGRSRLTATFFAERTGSRARKKKPATPGRKR